MTSINPLVPLQRRVEVSGKKINSFLGSSVRDRFQAEVDVRPLVSLQRRVEVSGKKINSFLDSSVRDRFQAEVDVRPPLALPSTTPTKKSELQALNRLQKASNSVAGARKELHNLNTSILKGQAIPIVNGAGKAGESYNSSLVLKGVPKEWELYNDTCFSLANQRDLYTNVIDKEGAGVTSFTQRISSGAEATGFLQRLNSVIQNICNSSKPPQNNNSQVSQSQTSSEGSKSFGFRLD